MSQYASEIFLIFVAQIFTVVGSLLLWKMYQRTRPAESKVINIQEQAMQHQVLMSELTIAKENLDAASQAFERERSKFEGRIALLEEQVEKQSNHIGQLEKDIEIARLKTIAAERDRIDLQNEKERILKLLAESDARLAISTQESLQAQIRAAVAERQSVELTKRFGVEKKFTGELA